MEENLTALDRKILVISCGLGPIGTKAAETILDSPKLKMVGAIEVAPEKAGKDLGDLLNLGRKVGVTVSADANEVMSQVDANVVLLATGSGLQQIYSQIEGIVAQGINCITSAEDVFFPYLRKYSPRGAVR